MGGEYIVTNYMGEHLVRARFLADLMKYQERLPSHSLCLAGGAVRDTLLNRLVKNRDYFTDCAMTTAQAGRVFGVSMHRVKLPRGLNYRGDDKQSSVRWVLTSEDQAIKCMCLLCEPCNQIVQFPDALSMCWLTSDGEIQYDGEFRQAINSKTVPYTTRMSEERLARIKDKYADYEFVATGREFL